MDLWVVYIYRQLSEGGGGYVRRLSSEFYFTLYRRGWSVRRGGRGLCINAVDVWVNCPLLEDQLGYIL